MKPLAASLIAVLALAAPAMASAQSRSYTAGYEEQGHYDYARVVRVDPIIEYGGHRTAAPQQACHYRRADDVYARDDGHYRDDGYRRDDYYEDDGYYRDRGARGDEAGRTMATVIGGIAGAVLGSKVGDGSGRYVGTAVGSMVGGMAGRSIYDNAQRERATVQRGMVRVCEPLPAGREPRYGGYDDGRVEGYDVTYEYAGRSYRTRTAYHPGDRIRVRVDVRPE